MKPNIQPDNSDAFAMFFKTIAPGGKASMSAFPTKAPESWDISQEEGKLAVDIAQTDDKIMVVSTMAGSLVDSIEVYVQNDVLTIRGERVSPVELSEEINYIHEECFWGKFSRTIVLPSEVKGELASAEFKSGILKIEIPKRKTDNKIPVIVVEE